MTAPQAPAPAAATTIHEATLASGPSGGVIRGREITQTAAIALRQAGLDIVVCGDDIKMNRTQAQTIEAAVGPYQRHVPHRQKTGPWALPHFQQLNPPPEGHSFYETTNRKSRKNP